MSFTVLLPHDLELDLLTNWIKYSSYRTTKFDEYIVQQIPNARVVEVKHSMRYYLSFDSELDLLHFRLKWGIHD